MSNPVIEEISIENFKCFKEKFTLKLNSGVNILVGDNEAGKSTILEAINLVLTGIFCGKYIKQDLSQYIFNAQTVEEYIRSLTNPDEVLPPPQILIELVISGTNLPFLEGEDRDGNAKCCVSLKVSLNDNYKEDYEEFIKMGDVKTIPIEWYQVSIYASSGQEISTREMPIKCSLIDSSTYKSISGSDIFIHRTIKDILSPEELIGISQAHRKMRDSFMHSNPVEEINNKIKNELIPSDKKVKISVDLSTKNAWESSLMTYVDNIPFHHIGKGEQSIIKTRLALSHKKVKESNLLLIEEPENHLSYYKLNELIDFIERHNSNKQVIITTHSSFVLNKLGLEKLILLNKTRETRFINLSEDTRNFFKKLPGYNTLRLVLCKKAILVEGDCDELIVQKAFKQNNESILPIVKGIDVISVGTSFLRFLEISENLHKDTVVVTDNDGNKEAILKKYAQYLGENKKDYIKICFENYVDPNNELHGNKFNFNTLEPNLLRVNSLELFNKIFEKKLNYEEMLKYMHSNKTDVALKLFEFEDVLNFPDYINDAIK